MFAEKKKIKKKILKAPLSAQYLKSSAVFSRKPTDKEQYNNSRLVPTSNSAPEPLSASDNGQDSINGCERPACKSEKNTREFRTHRRHSSRLGDPIRKQNDSSDGRSFFMPLLHRNSNGNCY